MGKENWTMAICTNCLFIAECKHRLRSLRPILHCNEYICDDRGRTMPLSSTKSESNNKE